MEWSKIKNIILLMLTLVNVFLLVLVTGRESVSSQYQAEARLDVVNLLLAQGIAVDIEELPQEMTLSPLTIVRDDWEELSPVGTLLGELEPDAVGEVYRGTYGTGRFSADGGFSVMLEAGAYPLEEGADAQQVAMEALEAMGLEAVVLEYKESEGIVVAQQLWENAPVFNVQTVLRFEAGSLLELRGVRVVGEATVQEGQTPLTVATVLLNFLAYLQDTGTICREIHSMTAGYQLSAAQISPVYLTPIWEIIADGVTYEVDALSGTVSLLIG